MEADHGPTPARRARRILCAEDHDLIREVIVTALRSAGFSVATAPDGQLAWETLSADLAAFDLLITDYEMPALTGLALVRKVRGTDFHGKILVQSSGLTPKVYSAFRELKVDGIIPKTVNPEAIVGAVTRLAGF